MTVVSLECLETLGERQRSRANVDSTVLLQQGVAGSQYSVFKLTVHNGIEDAVEHHHIHESMFMDIFAEYLNHAYDLTDIERAFLLEVGFIGKHLVTLLHEHVGIGTTPGTEVHRALVLLQGRQHIVFVE